MGKLADVLRKNEEQIRDEWIKGMASATRRNDLMNDAEMRQQSADVLSALSEGAASGNTDLRAPEWSRMRDLMETISASRASQGFTPAETMTFILSLKQPLFSRLKQEMGKDVEGFAKETWDLTSLLDGVAMLTADAFQKSRERVIVRQQQELLELSTPVVKLWDGILALPVIGTLDSARTQVVMESLLSTIVQTNSRVAIIDITGVPTVDTLVAQHLLKTITAARLMGAECIISGVRPQIAQTIVHLGIDLQQVITKARMSDAFALALSMNGKAVTKVAATKPTAMSSGPAKES
jgi:rsbT co-antagonist protein RsbR